MVRPLACRSFRSRLTLPMIASLVLAAGASFAWSAEPQTVKRPDGNRLAYLDENNPYYPHRDFPKLITPQWVGEEGVECVVVLAIDDMREPARYETYLRPILNRLKQIDGRAPVSIMTCNVKPDDPQLAQFLAEGLNIDVHTVDHPCPLLAGGDFAKAKSTYDRCVDLLNEIPGNKPVAFRMPCCDSLNTVSPRFFAEIFNKTTAKGNALAISSSVFNRFTPNDPAIPRELAFDEEGRDRFGKYEPKGVPRGRQSFDTFVNTIEDYPYPYVINRLCWEFPCVTPSDWSAQHLQKPFNPVTIRDLKAALDITVIKQGVFNLVFHPYGWIKPEQVVELIDHAVAKHGKKVKFLNFREALERLNKNVLGGESLRTPDGADGGSRLLDVDANGFIDVVTSNERLQRTRLWSSEKRAWVDVKGPGSMGLASDRTRPFSIATARFGVLSPSGRASLFANDREEKVAPSKIHELVTAVSFSRFDGEGERAWAVDDELVALLNRAIDVERSMLVTAQGGLDRGVRFRDVDGDGICELITRQAVYSIDPATRMAKDLPFRLPKDVALVDATGRDAGLRFADIDEDGRDDIVFSNAERYGVYLFADMKTGWSRVAMEGTREAAPATATPNENAAALSDAEKSKIQNRTSKIAIPPIARADGSDNGFFVHSRHLFWQNEDTDRLLDLVDRVAFNDILIQGEQHDLQPQAKSPEASLKSIQVRPGLTVELMASEPLTFDPIAFSFGADGKLWVVEMTDYPLGKETPRPVAELKQGGDKVVRPGGCIRCLEDTDGDGRYDKSTIFVEVPYPTGVLPWRKGVLVCAAPDIFYAEDTNGDGKADKREVLYTGFREGNQQHRVNGLVRGLDNWIYLANGDSGGRVRYVGPPPTRPDLRRSATSEPVDISGRDIRIRPESGEVEAIDGQTQFGRSRDDFGNWFGCSNSNPMWQYVLEDHYQRRNRYFAAPSARSDVPEVGGNAPVFPTSLLLARFNDYNTANRFTSACSAVIYRDDLFGPQFAGNMFVCEPVHNLVHREVLTPEGVTFRSRRAADEQQSEFLASSDNWFRPTTVQTGPDGALWIADMYRLVIEHPQWIPDTFQKKLDLQAGFDQGRIYRVYPVGTKPRAVPRLDRLDTAGLVAALDSPSGWQRDTAQQLIIERFTPGNAAPPSTRDIAQCVLLLEKQGRESKNPLCRLHALCTLGGLAHPSTSLLLHALRDEHPAVRRHAVRLCESLPERPSELISGLVKLVDDADPAVRLQLAYTLGEVADLRAGVALGMLLNGAQGDRWLFAAAMSSLSVGNIEQVLTAVLRGGQATEPNTHLLETLLNQAASLGNARAFHKLLSTVTTPQGGRFEAWQLAAIGTLLDTLERKRESLADLRKSNDQTLRGALENIDLLFAFARAVAATDRESQEVRLAGIKLLGRGTDQQEADRNRLGTFLTPQSPPALQLAAVAALGRLRDREVGEMLLAAWRGYGPARRGQVLDALISRDPWTELLLDAIEAKTVAPADIDAARRQRLVANRSSAIRDRATKLLAVTGNADRQQVLDTYRPALSRAGDPQRGGQLFAKTCAQCHKLAGAGHEVGPDIASLTDKSPEALLVAILDPNRALENKFVNYVAITKAGLQHTGLLVDETGNSITLRGPEAKEQTILRADLEELTSTTKSVMPEGLEKDLRPEDIADLVAYVRANVPLPKPKVFAGNKPELVRPAADGTLLLTSGNCEIYGSTLVYEPEHANLGYWASADDYATWTIDVPAAGKYQVEIHASCDDSVKNNPYRLECAGQVLAGRTISTGNWETYRESPVGEITLPQGEQQITLRPVGRPQGALIDLKSIRLKPAK